MPDDLWTGFEVLEGRAFGHNQTLVCPLTWLKQSSSDKTFVKLKKQKFGVTQPDCLDRSGVNLGDFERQRVIRFRQSFFKEWSSSQPRVREAGIGLVHEAAFAEVGHAGKCASQALLKLRFLSGRR